MKYLTKHLSSLLALLLGASALFGTPPSDKSNGSSLEPTSQTEQDSNKSNLLGELAKEQYNLLKENNQYNDSSNDQIIAELNTEMAQDDVFSHKGGLATLFQDEEEFQLALLNKNLGANQQVTLDTVQQVLTDKEKLDFQNLEAALLPIAALPVAVSDVASADQAQALKVYNESDLNNWYSATSYHQEVARFFRLEYLKFVVITRGVDAREQSEHYAVKLDLVNIKGRSSDDLLSLAKRMIVLENGFLSQQK